MFLKNLGGIKTQIFRLHHKKLSALLPYDPQNTFGGLKKNVMTVLNDERKIRLKRGNKTRQTRP